MDVFKNRLRELRANRRQIDIANQLGISVQNYSAFENGREPSYDILVELADLHNVSIDYLLGRIDQKGHENVQINEITGLDDDAINVLKNSKSLSMAINFFIKDNDFIDLMRALWAYSLFDSAKKLPKEILPYELTSGATYETLDDFYLYLVADQFKAIAKSLRKKVKEYFVGIN